MDGGICSRRSVLGGLGWAAAGVWAGCPRGAAGDAAATAVHPPAQEAGPLERIHTYSYYTYDPAAPLPLRPVFLQTQCLFDEQGRPVKFLMRWE